MSGFQGELIAKSGPVYYAVESERVVGWCDVFPEDVYTTNKPAIALYKKFGFEQEGLIQKYRKLDGRYFDCLVMGKFL